MDKSGPSALFVNLLEIDDELVGVVLGVSEDLGTKEGDDVLADHIARFALKVRVVDAQMRVEPVDLVGDQLGRYESLCLVRQQAMATTAVPTFAATSAWTRARCSSLPLKTGVVYPGTFLIRCNDVSLVVLEPGTARWAALAGVDIVELRNGRNTGRWWW